MRYGILLMAAQILPFTAAKAPVPSPTARCLRVGEAHQQLANLYAAGRLCPNRAVIDASRFRQGEWPRAHAVKANVFLGPLFRQNRP